ncbi:MAG: efflux RND transporter periplasmic adaptor subunit, partial [Chloroflexi bacterium]|nr:efflux RND transporter periplasmic adaptor subunit [Chloroflexota bacterium]
NANAAARTRNLQTAVVQRGTLIATVSEAGNVAAPDAVDLNFKSSGRVTKVDVTVGAKVNKGRVLMTLDPTDLDLALKTAQDNLVTARSNYARVAGKAAVNPDQLIAAKAALDNARLALQNAQAAYDTAGGASNPNIAATTQAVSLTVAADNYQAALASYTIAAQNITATSVITAQAQLEQAQTAVDQATANLNDANIISPIDGVVAAVNFHVGDSANGSGAGASSSSTISGTSSTGSGSTGSETPTPQAGSSTTGGATPAVTVVNLSSLQVQATVAEVDLPKIKTGDKADVTFDALPGKTYSATVTEMGPAGTVTEGVVNYPITLALTNADTAVMPGMTANLNIAVDQAKDVLFIPTRAVHTQGNRKVVTRLVGGKEITTPITTGLANDQDIQEIMDGHKAGETVTVTIFRGQKRMDI